MHPDSNYSEVKTKIIRQIEITRKENLDKLVKSFLEQLEKDYNYYYTPKYTYITKPEGLVVVECSICYEPYKDNNIKRFGNCSHTACVSCMEKMEIMEDGAKKFKCHQCRYISPHWSNISL